MDLRNRFALCFLFGTGVRGQGFRELLLIGLQRINLLRERLNSRFSIGRNSLADHAADLFQFFFG